MKRRWSSRGRDHALEARTLRSASSIGVMPSFCAVCTILMAVLVGAGEEIHVLAVETLETGDARRSQSLHRRGRCAARRLGTQIAVVT
jgi:hypothetical protein